MKELSSSVLIIKVFIRLVCKTIQLCLYISTFNQKLLYSTVVHAIIVVIKSNNLRYMKKKSLSVFHRIGLGAREEKVYRALLAAGPSSISEISRRTGLPRVTLYTLLPHLLALGLILQSPKGKYKVYYAESPQKITSLLTEGLQQSESEIAQMEEVRNMNSGRPKITYGEGFEAVRSIMSDVIHSLGKDGVYYRYSSSSALKRENTLKYLPGDYLKLREEKGLERYVITNEFTRSKKKPALGRDLKVVPQEYDLFEYNITQVIYGNKVAIVDYNNETAITIENATLAEFQKKIFKLLFYKL